MYQFYQDWSTGKLPHMLILLIQHANPYYDDSYAVNSENVGPYGDAINQELIPYIERQFRGIGQGWARGVFGGSTGGWETLATQVFYPDNFNGAWAFCPDPVDFHAYQAVNIYEEKNAFWKEGPFGRVPIPDMRGLDGLPEAMMEGDDRWELVLGTHGRSGEQFGIWQAVFSPVGDDGYPKPIWDPETGMIDHQVGDILARTLRFNGYSAARLGHAGAETERQNSRFGRHARYVVSGSTLSVCSKRRSKLPATRITQVTSITVPISPTVIPAYLLFPRAKVH